MSQIAARIREKRQREHLSLRDAAVVSGVSFSTLARIEGGKTPSLAVHQRIVAWLEGATPTLPAPPMSLRDWFAGQAICLAAPGSEYVTNGKFVGMNWAEYVAVESYAIADAMLAQRERAK